MSQSPPPYCVSQDQHEYQSAPSPDMSFYNRVTKIDAEGSGEEASGRHDIRLGPIKLGETVREHGRLEDGTLEDDRYSRGGRPVSGVIYVATQGTVLLTMSIHVIAFLIVIVGALAANHYFALQSDGVHPTHTPDTMGATQLVWSFPIGVVAVYASVVGIMLYTPVRLDSRFTTVTYTAAVTSILVSFSVVLAMLSK